MNINKFHLFLEQQERFSKALIEYDPHVWFPPLRGNFEPDNPGNWFISFVPASWGHWTGATYGVHFDFLYGRPRGKLPERIRLAVGVENPMKLSGRQTFKEQVISKVRSKGISSSGFVLQAKDKTKLLESDPIPFNGQSWQISLHPILPCRHPPVGPNPVKIEGSPISLSLLWLDLKVVFV